MNAMKSSERSFGVHLTPWDLERLVQILGGDEMLTGLSVDLSDGSTVSPERPTEIAQLKNDKGRVIDTVTLESAPPPFSFADAPVARVAIVSLHRSRSATIRYHVSGEHREVMRLSRELDEWSSSVTPWYGRLATLDAPRLGGGVLLLASALALISATLFLLLGGQAGGSPSVYAVVAVVALGALLAAGLAIAARPSFVFPVALLTVGGGERRAHRLARRRALVLWGSGALAVLTLVGSVLAALAG